MSRKFKFDESGDSADLQALFDSIAAQPGQRPAAGAAKEPRVEVVGGTATMGDSPELEALFDSVAGQASPPAVTEQGAAAPGLSSSSFGMTRASRALARSEVARRRWMSDFQGMEDLLQDFLVEATGPSVRGGQQAGRPREKPA
jgi:hypothetical protein